MDRQQGTNKIMQDYGELFGKLSTKKAIVVGDVMVDAYMIGGVDRISPEAPVPIVAVNDRKYRLGGAANVALNIAAFGADAFAAKRRDEISNDGFVSCVVRHDGSLSDSFG